MWECEIEAERLATLLGGAVSVSKEAYLTVDEDRMKCTALNGSNTAFGIVSIPVNVVGDPSEFPTDIGKMFTMLPQTGSIKLHYDGDIIHAHAGRTKYKFYKFADTAVRKAPDKLIMTLPNSVDGIDPKEFYDAINKTVQSYSDTIGAFYKIRIEVSDGILKISDMDRNIDTEISCITEAPSGYVVVSSNYILSLAMYVKKFIKSSIQLQMYTPEHPLILRHESDMAYMYYLVAPIVEAD